MKAKIFGIVLIGMLALNAVHAQPIPAAPATSSTQESAYNPHSVRPINKHYVMFKKALWFRVDMREKMNSPFHAKDNELTKLIIEAVRSGKLTPYTNDSLTTPMSLEEFNERLIVPASAPKGDDGMAALEALDEDNEEAWGKKKKEPKAAAPKTGDEFFPKQLYLMEIKEDYVFDRIRSRMYHDMQAVTIIIPGEQSPLGLDKVLGSFSYKELVNNVFKNNPRAVWFNEYNPAEHRNLSDAFDLRLFSGQLVKYENPRNNRIEDIFGNTKKALQESEQQVYKLMEYEALLWSN